jgi:hypothetical protein
MRPSSPTAPLALLRAPWQLTESGPECGPHSSANGHPGGVVHDGPDGGPHRDANGNTYPEPHSRHGYWWPRTVLWLLIHFAHFSSCAGTSLERPDIMCKVPKQAVLIDE